MPLFSLKIRLLPATLLMFTDAVLDFIWNLRRASQTTAGICVSIWAWYQHRKWCAISKWQLFAWYCSIASIDF